MGPCWVGVNVRASTALRLPAWCSPAAVVQSGSAGAPGSRSTNSQPCATSRPAAAAAHACRRCRPAPPYGVAPAPTCSRSWSASRMPAAATGGGAALRSLRPRVWRISAHALLPDRHRLSSAALWPAAEPGSELKKAGRGRGVGVGLLLKGCAPTCCGKLSDR